MCLSSKAEGGETVSLGHFERNHRDCESEQERIVKREGKEKVDKGEGGERKLKQ